MIGWVVGASGAWGRAVALELLRRDWDVVALGRRDVPDMAAWARRQGRGWSHHALDLRTAPDRLAESLAGLLDAPDALFLCGAATGGDREDLLRANYLGPVALIELAATRMRAAGGGRIGVFLAQNARLGLPGLGDFSASQAALWTWCESLQAEPERFPGVSLTRVIPPRTASATQRFVSDRSGHHPSLRPPRAGGLVSAVLAGRRRTGRRPVGAALSMLVR